MRDSEPTISCVLPWQGSAEALRHHVLPLLDDVSALVRLWELILVDDACSDADAAAMAAWTEVEGIRIVRLARRVGRDAAVDVGLQLAHGDVVVVLQGDDPRASELIAGLLVRWRQGFDVVHSAEPNAPVALSVATRLGRWLGPSSVSGNRLASMRTAHRALLVDRSVVQGFVSPQARATKPGAHRLVRPLQVAAVLTPPLLGAKPPARGPGGGIGTAAKKAVAVMREAGRSLCGWRASSAIDPVIEVRDELGIGLAPRTSAPGFRGAGFDMPAEPHA